MGRRKRGVLVDAVDARILEFLQRDARTPVTAIARTIHLSDVSVRRRIERLVRDEVVTFRAHVDPLKVGFSVWAVVWIQVEPRLVDAVARQIERLPGVVLLCLGTGEFDIYAVVVLPSANDFASFLNDRLLKIRGVRRTTTSYITRVLKRDFAFGVPLAADRDGSRPVGRSRLRRPDSRRDRKSGRPRRVTR